MKYIFDEAIFTYFFLNKSLEFIRGKVSSVLFLSYLIEMTNRIEIV